MRKVFLDDLPRWEGKIRRIDWTKSEGQMVKFEYNNLFGEIEILKNNPGGMLEVQYKNKVFKIDSCSFKNGKIGRVLGVITSEFKADVGNSFKDESRDITIIDREYRENIDKTGNSKWYKCYCNKCKYEYWVIEPSLISNKTGCPCCTNQIVVVGFNDIPTTNPEMVKCFQGGYDEAKLYTKKSGKKIKTKCYFCEKEIIMPIYSIKDDQISCNDCKGIKISRKLSKCSAEDSFAENDVYNKLQYWDYKKNKEMPNVIKKGSGKKFWFTCRNNHSFKATMSHINGKRNTWCPHCSNLLRESKMASVIKQIMKNKFPCTIWEHDIGFKGVKGGVSKYDMFIPELNLLLEFQSEYHDDKKELDKEKRDFAINRGYDFLEMDHRDFDIIKAIQVFFPDIKVIPEYVVYEKNTRIDWDIEEAQRLLTETNMNQLEVASTVGAERGSFYAKVFRGALEIPKEKRIEVPVVQLDFKGNFVRKHDKANKFKRYGFNTPDICQCCKGSQKTHKGFLFMYENKYNAIKNPDGSIEIKEDYEKIYTNTKEKEVFQFDLKGNLVETYKSVSEASAKSGFLTSNISACCNKITKTSNNYLWVYKNDYTINPDCIKVLIKESKPNLYTKGVVRIRINDWNCETYESARDANRKVGVDYRNICYRCKKKYNGKDKYIWLYEEDFCFLQENNLLLIEDINNFKKEKYNL